MRGGRDEVAASSGDACKSCDLAASQRYFYHGKPGVLVMCAGAQNKKGHVSDYQGR